MVSKKYALVRMADGWVWNVCVWDGVTPWNHLPPGIQEMECPEEVSPGWFFADGNWTPPPLPPDPPEE
jgi:hypothetical protein